jgi:hypothetical protein
MGGIRVAPTIREESVGSVSNLQCRSLIIANVTFLAMPRPGWAEDDPIADTSNEDCF